MGEIKVSEVGKAYKSYPSRWARIIEWISPWRRGRHQLKWILRDVSFSVSAGESIGIIGINGAGKSTLLKIITGTTQSTTGSVKVSGRVSALLELGIGFHPDFTGRENVYMSAQLLGHSSEEISQCMQGIEEFADIGDYIDMPVRVYSSGMQVRLAFSVATAIRPDILIVDEALAVGDILFQHKCMERISRFRKDGTTLILVTHDFASLTAICDRALLISDGRVDLDGPCKKVVERYFEVLSKNKGKAKGKEDARSLADEKNSKMIAESLFESHSRYIKEVFISGLSEIDGLMVCGDQAKIIIKVCGLSKYIDPHVGFRIQDARGGIVFETNTYCQGVSLESLGADLCEFILRVDFQANFAPGEYVLAVGIENEAYGDGFFKSVILPTKIIKSFVVAQGDKGKLWSGRVNIYPEFSLQDGQYAYS